MFISVSAGILQKPLYDVSNPIAINYGAFGSILGHEIMHAFDRHGAMYDLNGLDKFWWSNETLQRFNSESDCVVNSYLNYINETGQVFFVSHLIFSSSEQRQTSCSESLGRRDFFESKPYMIRVRQVKRPPCER